MCETSVNIQNGKKLKFGSFFDDTAPNMDKTEL